LFAKIGMQPRSSNLLNVFQAGIVLRELSQFFGSNEPEQTIPHALAVSESGVLMIGASVSAFAKFIK